MCAARDTRRQGMLVGGTNKKHVVRQSYDVMAKDDALAVRNAMEQRIAGCPGDGIAIM